MAVSTIRNNSKQTRNDISDFDRMFNTLGPLKYHEVNWAGQKYASASSAANSIRAVLNKRDDYTIHVKQSKDKVYVYSDEYAGILPCDTKLTLMDAFKRADVCLRKYELIEQWPIPTWLIPDYDGLTNFQIGMKIRDELKAIYPYLTVTPIGKTGFAIKRDKSYGGLCTNADYESVADEIEEPTNDVEVSVVEDIPEEPIAITDTVEETSYQMQIEMGITNPITNEPIASTSYLTFPELPFALAADVAKYLSSHGYSASMSLIPSVGDEYLATVTITSS